MSKALPRGLRIDHGYVQVRLMHQGHTYCKNFGADSPLARELAGIHLAEKRKEILMGKAGIEPELSERKFRELVPLYMKYWSEQKDGDGQPKHDERSIKERQRVFDKTLTPFFGNMAYHLIRTVDVERWQQKQLDSGILGTSVNRYMVPLADMYSDLIRLVELCRIPKFKMPAINPCANAEKAKMRVRNRIPTDYELRKLHLAFTTLADPDGWEICALALQSVLSEKDLRKLEIGSTLDLERSKTSVAVHIPITVLQTLNWKNWGKRWRKARANAGLHDLQFRDLRKKGSNEVIGKFDVKLVSQYLGHASIKTTEKSYVLLQQEKMRPIAEHLATWVKTL